jgi:hypothetical protein
MINLVQLDDLTSIVMNFISLLVLAQFDDFFVEIFLRSKVKAFIEKDLDIKSFRQHKLKISFL